jgi:energy-coupling factor transport system permease protein
MLDQLCYEERDAFLQQLHPLVTVFYLAVLFVLSLLFDHPLYLLGILAVTVLAVLVSHVADKYELYLTIGLWTALMILIFNPLVSHSGQTVLLEGPSLPLLGKLNITLESICYGAMMGVRLLAVITAFALYNAVVHPDKLTRLFSRVAYKSSLIVSLATRMLPGVARDLANAREAQLMRGVDFSSGSFREKLRKSSWLLDVLLLSSLEGSLEISEAMYARAFGSGQRSSYRRELVRPRDYLCLGATLLALGLSIYVKVCGLSDYSYFPQMGKLAATPEVLIWLGLIMLLLLLPVITAGGWRHWHWLRSRI